MAAAAFTGAERAVEVEVGVRHIDDIANDSPVFGFNFRIVAFEANFDRFIAHEFGTAGAAMRLVAIEAGALIIEDDGVIEEGFGCGFDDVGMARTA